MFKYSPMVAAAVAAWLLGCGAHEMRAQAGGPQPSMADTGTARTLSAGVGTAVAGTAGAAADSGRLSPLGKPDPRAIGDSTLTRQEQQKKDQKFLEDLRWGHVDSMHLNEKVVIALHAVPRSERRKPEEVALAVEDCDALVTGVPPGEWDIFVIAAGYDQITGVSMSFNFPEDWVIHGFTPNPDIGQPLVLGEVKSNAPRPFLIAFDCVVHPDKLDKLPEGLKPAMTAKVAVIGRIELTAPSAGSFVLSDCPTPAYGLPEVACCWGGRTTKVPAGARGRIDVGQGTGVRPCAAGGPLAVSPASEPAAGNQGSSPR